MRPVVLDFDQSVSQLAGAAVLPLARWQESIRFACPLRRLRELAGTLAPQLQATDTLAFLGSGDFHHVSYLLIERLARLRPVEVVVIDNHPDNMRFPFGIHCGSWVRHLAQLPWVTHVHVLGITSSDVATANLWENYLSPLWQGRLTYWSLGVDFRWARRLRWRDSFRAFDDTAALLRAFRAHQQGSVTPIYLSIDKDALSPEVVQTNWDQGRFTEADLHSVIDAVHDRIIGCDITGEVSVHRYRTAWKRWLSARDRQPEIPAAALAAWQRQHHAVNERLLLKLAPLGWEATASR